MTFWEFVSGIGFLQFVAVVAVIAWGTGYIIDKLKE